MGKRFFPIFAQLNKAPAFNSTIPDQSEFCCYCGHRFDFNRRLTKDHLIPRSKGGANNNYNKRNCCSICNREKAALFPQDYLIELQRRLNAGRGNRYDLEIKIENVKYIIHYVETAGQKVFSDFERYWLFRRRYVPRETYLKGQCCHFFSAKVVPLPRTSETPNGV